MKEQVARVRELRECWDRERQVFALLDRGTAPRFFDAMVRDLDAALDGTDGGGHVDA